MDLELVKIDFPEGMNIIFGQSHFIKTVEDIHEALAISSPGIRYGMAFAEASGPRLIRKTGNNPELVDIAVKNIQNIGSGHVFLIILENVFPIAVMHALKTVPEICNIFCATGNPTYAVVARNEQGGGVLGVIDGFSPAAVESDNDIANRKKFLRDIVEYKQ
ncbi:MAG: adenosine-specific kinase [Candidatus Zixiibacteriota bacterium]